MTIIAAIAINDGVLMACDTRADYNGTAIYKAEGKIGTLTTPRGEKVLIAASGNSAILPTLLRHLKIGDTPNPESVVGADEWANAVAEAATGVLADANPPLLNTADSDNAAAFDGTALLAWRQHLWILHTHGVIRPADDVAVIGCGSEIGLGSLHTSRQLGLDPRAGLELAVRLAATYNSGCGVDGRGPLVHTTL
ncbi:hypothetical protein [Nocardia sp. CY41]|uniref:hypothetical protein n=1 Tax=Nocardia sp. CY41 TaxID=2608686 RepID=UPI00135C51DD|nr:hypothetical protein [Nocardia sp. CY41]